LLRPARRVDGDELSGRTGIDQLGRSQVQRRPLDTYAQHDISVVM
jgi:hypothetical protein